MGAHKVGDFGHVRAGASKRELDCGVMKVVEGVMQVACGADVLVEVANDVLGFSEEGSEDLDGCVGGIDDACLADRAVIQSLVSVARPSGCPMGVTEDLASGIRPRVHPILASSRSSARRKGSTA